MGADKHRRRLWLREAIAARPQPFRIGRRAKQRRTVRTLGLVGHDAATLGPHYVYLTCHHFQENDLFPSRDAPLKVL